MSRETFRLYQPDNPDLALQDGEVYVFCGDDVVWPARVAYGRYLMPGLRPPVAELFCQRQDELLVRHGDDAVDKLIYVDQRLPAGPGEPTVYRLTPNWEQPGQQDSVRPLAYDLDLDQVADGGSRIFIAAGWYMWQLLDPEDHDFDQPKPAETGHKNSDDTLLITVSTNGSGHVTVTDAANGDVVASADLRDVPEDRLDHELAAWLADVFRTRARELQ